MVYGSCILIQCCNSGDYYFKNLAKPGQLCTIQGELLVQYLIRFHNLSVSIRSLSYLLAVMQPIHSRVVTFNHAILERMVSYLH